MYSQLLVATMASIVYLAVEEFEEIKEIKDGNLVLDALLEWYGGKIQNMKLWTIFEINCNY